MKAVIWGARGSLPTSVRAGTVRDKVFCALQAARDVNLETDEQINQFIDEQLPFAGRGTYSCNTSCVEIQHDDDFIIFDAGSGLRDFGNDFMKSRMTANPPTFHILMSHIHWDHIHGFPFFVPSYIPGNRIRFYGCHEDIEKAIRGQSTGPCFPVEYEDLGAEISYQILTPGETVTIQGFAVTPFKQDHPGDSYGYRVERDGKSIVYSTDSEHKGPDVGKPTYPFIQHFSEADLVIFDAQYIFLESVNTKESWGHSSNMIGVELAVDAKVKRLCLFHHDPLSDDQTLDRILDETRRYAARYVKNHQDTEAAEPQILSAYENLEIDV